MSDQHTNGSEWESQVDPAVASSVKLATAAFSLARFYYEVPYEDTRNRFTDPEMSSTWPQRDPASVSALESIARENESQLVVGRDFEALFGPTQLVPCRESTWTKQDSARLTQELRAVYAEAQYTPIRDGALPMDHFAIELSFLGDRVAKSHKDSTSAQDALNFYSDHLKAYVPQLLEALTNNARSVLYQNIAVLTQSTLDALLQHCQSIIDEDPSREAGN